MISIKNLLGFNFFFAHAPKNFPKFSIREKRNSKIFQIHVISIPKLLERMHFYNIFSIWGALFWISHWLGWVLFTPSMSIFDFFKASKTFQLKFVQFIRFTPILLTTFSRCPTCTNIIRSFWIFENFQMLESQKCWHSTFFAAWKLLNFFILPNYNVIFKTLEFCDFENNQFSIAKLIVGCHSS